MSQKTAAKTTRPANPDFQDADRHGGAMDAVANLESSALYALAHSSEAEAAAAIRALAARTRSELQQARRAVQAREAEIKQLRTGISETEELLENPAHCAPDLTGHKDRHRALALRAAEALRRLLIAVPRPKTANGI